MSLPLQLVDPDNPPVVYVDWDTGDVHLGPLPVVNIEIGVGIPGPSPGFPVVRNLTAASSVSVTHTFLYPPNVWFVRADGESMSYGVEYPDSSHVSVSFPTPFTGTMIVG